MGRRDGRVSHVDEDIDPASKSVTQDTKTKTILCRLNRKIQLVGRQHGGVIRSSPWLGSQAIDKSNLVRGNSPEFRRLSAENSLSCIVRAPISQIRFKTGSEQLNEPGRADRGVFTEVAVLDLSPTKDSSSSLALDRFSF